MKLLDSVWRGIGSGLLRGLLSLPGLAKRAGRGRKGRDGGILGWWVEHDEDGIPSVRPVTKRGDLPRWLQKDSDPGKKE